MDITVAPTRIEGILESWSVLIQLSPTNEILHPIRITYPETSKEPENKYPKTAKESENRNEDKAEYKVDPYN